MWIWAVSAIIIDDIEISASILSRVTLNKFINRRVLLRQIMAFDQSTESLINFIRSKQSIHECFAKMACFMREGSQTYYGPLVNYSEQSKKIINWTWLCNGNAHSMVYDELNKMRTTIPSFVILGMPEEDIPIMMHAEQRLDEHFESLREYGEDEEGNNVILVDHAYFDSTMIDLHGMFY